MSAPDNVPQADLSFGTDDLEPCSTITSLEKLPKELGRFFTERDDALEPLREEYAWLKEFDPSHKPDMLKLQKTFLEDSFAFMKGLGEFLQVRKWQEFVVHMCCFDSIYGPALLALLTYVFDDKTHGLRAAAASSDAVYSVHRGNHSQEDLKALEAPYAGEPNLSGFFKVLRSRYDEIASLDNNSHVRFLWEGLCDKTAAKLNLDKPETHKRLRVVVSWIRKVDSVNVGAMTFNYTIIKRKSAEPRPLLLSAHWQRIGNILCSLGLLVGADVPRWPEEPKPMSVIAALQKVANNEGRAITVMLARLSDQSITIRKQQQAITALQFRHLLEMIPSGGTAPPQGQATRQWKKFWQDAVTKAYEEYISTPTPPPQGHQPRSPLVGLLKDQFKKAGNQRDANGNALNQADQTRWLIDETIISQQAQDLYGTLSQVIHSYSSTEFSINSLSYSPRDVQLLNILSPTKIVNGAVDWAAEKDRYVWP